MNQRKTFNDKWASHDSLNATSSFIKIYHWKSYL